MVGYPSDSLASCYRLSSVCNACIVAKGCVCVLEQKLLLTAYTGSRIWEIDWYQNEWPWPLFRSRSRSCQVQPLQRQYLKTIELETSSLVHGFVWGK